MPTCETCIFNDDLLCDLYGCLVEDDDTACSRHRTREETRKANRENGEKASGKIRGSD